MDSKAGARASKTAIKTAKPSPRSGVALPVGRHPQNTGGKKGRSGRPSQKLVDFLAELRQSPDFHAAIEKAGLSPNHRGFASAVKLATEYDRDKPAKSVVVRLEGYADVARAFAVIQDVIRARLAPDVAASLIAELQQEMNRL